MRPGDAVTPRYALLTAAHLLASLAGFGAVLLIVDRFGAAGLGEISLALSLVGYAVTVATCGTGLDAVRRVAAEPASAARVAGTVIAVRLLMGVASYLGLAVLVTLVPRLAAVESLVLIFGLGVFVSALNVSWLPQARHRTLPLAAAELGTQGLYLAGLWLLLSERSGLATVALARVGAELLVAGGLLAWMLARFGPPRPPRGFGEVRRTIVEGAPLGGTKLIRALALGSDLLVVGLLVSAEALGHYAAAVKVFLFLMSLTVAYFVILLPRVAERAARPGGEMAAEIRASLARVLPPAILALALVAAGARPLLTGLFGASFAEAAPALRLLALALLASLVGRHYRQVLIARGRQTTDLRLTAVAAAVHVLLKLALVPILGLTGAALGTLAGEAVLAFSLRRAALPELAAAGGRPAAVAGAPDLGAPGR